jgi:hypothetical protein
MKLLIALLLSAAPMMARETLPPPFRLHIALAPGGATVSVVNPAGKPVPPFQQRPVRIVVEHSADGRTWAPVGHREGAGFIALPPSTGRVALYRARYETL